MMGLGRIWLTATVAGVTVGLAILLLGGGSTSAAAGWAAILGVPIATTLTLAGLLLAHRRTQQSGVTLSGRSDSGGWWKGRGLENLAIILVGFVIFVTIIVMVANLVGNHPTRSSSGAQVSQITSTATTTRAANAPTKPVLAMTTTTATTEFEQLPTDSPQSLPSVAPHDVRCATTVTLGPRQGADLDSPCGDLWADSIAAAGVDIQYSNDVFGSSGGAKFAELADAAEPTFATCANRTTYAAMTRPLSNMVHGGTYYCVQTDLGAFGSVKIKGFDVSGVSATLDVDVLVWEREAKVSSSGSSSDDSWFALFVWILLIVAVVVLLGGARTAGKGAKK